MNDWKNYNKNLIENAKELIKANKKSNFNVEEQRCYPHVRDLVALTIANIDYINIKILDYGSNIMPWANIQNKINLKKISVTIYDPFAEKDYSKNIDFGFPIKIENDSNCLASKAFDLIIFGSSTQYIKDFYEKLINDEINLPRRVFFLDTPFSLKDELCLNQVDLSGREYTVFMRSYSKLIKIMEKKGYELIFKSSLNWETQTYLNKSTFPMLKMLNLLFKS